MIKPQDLYDKTRLPLNDTLINKLIDKYLSISSKDMNRDTKFREKGVSFSTEELYKQINYLNNKGIFNIGDRNLFMAELNNDVINAGKPYSNRNPLAVSLGWNTFQSWNILGTEKIPESEFTHRFYLAVPTEKVYAFAKVLYDEFKKANIPFYFKTDALIGDRTDKVVIYTSTKLLEVTMKVLENIEKLRPDLIASCQEPSIIVGRVTDKIGYASEDSVSNQSYTDIICSNFADVLESLIDLYIKKDVSPKIKRIYKEKIAKYQEAGITLEDKKRILLEILHENDLNFNKQLLDMFRKKLQERGIDLENICFSKEAREQIERLYGRENNKPIDVFSTEIQNKIITLPNGKKMTIAEYFRINNVLYWVPIEAKITFKSGRTISGGEFLAEAISRLDKFNTWQELVLYYGLLIERHPNVGTRKKQEKIQNSEIDDERRVQEQKKQELIRQMQEQVFLENMIRQNYGSDEVRKAK